VAIAQNVTELITVPNRHLEIYPDTFTGNHYLYGYFSQNYVASLQKRNANFDLDWELSSGKRTISDMGGGEIHKLDFQKIHVDSNGLIIANRGSQYHHQTCKTLFLDTNKTLFDSIDKKGFNGYFHNDKAVLNNCFFSSRYARYDNHFNKLDIDDYILSTT
jgi:hypothetical protein